MPTVRIQEKNYSESIMVLKLKDGFFYFCSAAKNHRQNLAPFCTLCYNDKRDGRQGKRAL